MLNCRASATSGCYKLARFSNLQSSIYNQQSMNPARIAELLQPFLDSANGQQLTSNDLHNISTYIDILLRWNARINLTAIRDEEQIVTRHFGESLFAARHLFPKSSVPSVVKDFEVADVGSGAGFPGVPIKLWAPNIALTLIESNHKKATFLREVARALTLTDINIQTDRAETLPPHSFDVVTLRAVERFETILPVAANLLRPAGRLALLIGSAQEPEARLILPSLLWSHPIPIPNSRTSILLLVQSPTPSEPRWS
jgi:16S rRNA (guanine527-N7)-methyltransferase